MTRPLARTGPMTFADSLPLRTALHPARKVFHFLTGFSFALANENFPRILWQFSAWTLFFLTALIEVIRIRYPNGQLNRQVLTAFRPFIRSHETHQFAGIMYYTFGVALSSTFFRQTCGTIGILALAMLDPIAAFAGSIFEGLIPEARLKNGKSLVGFAISTNLTAAFLWLVIHQAAQSSLQLNDEIAFAVLVAFIGAGIEVIIPSPQVIIGPKRFPFGIDDNMVIPVVSAFAAQWFLRTLPNRLIISRLLVWGL